MKTFILIVVLAAGVVSISFSAELTNAEQIVAFASAKATEYKTFSADFAQSLNMMGMTMDLSGRLMFKQPNLLRMEAEVPMIGQRQKMLCVSDSNQTVWTEMAFGSTKRVMKMEHTGPSTNMADPSSSLLKNDPRRQFENLKEKYDLRYVRSEDLHEEPMYLLEATPKTDAKWTTEEKAISEFVGKSRVYIGRRDGFLHKLQQLDKTGTNIFTTMEMQNVKFNIEFPDETFVYTPPKEVQVIDITGVGQQMQHDASAAAGTNGARSAPAPKE